MTSDEEKQKPATNAWKETPLLSRYNNNSNPKKSLGKTNHKDHKDHKAEKIKSHKNKKYQAYLKKEKRKGRGTKDVGKVGKPRFM